MNGSWQWRFLTNIVKRIRVCVWWQRRGNVTGHMAAGGWGIGMVFRRPGEDMTGWKKPPQRFRTETQADKKTQAGIQSNSQFCCSQHKHATSPWHTRFSSLLAPLAKNFSSFETEEGSKQTLSARHQVSTYSLCCHKTTVMILIPVLGLITKSLIW